MKMDFEKIGIIASHFAKNIDGLYVTKLFKLFYYLDFISYNQRGSSVTNDTYFKLPYGPVPSIVKNEVDNLVASASLGDKIRSQLAKNIELKSDADNFGRVVVNINKDYNLRHLSAYELKLVNALILRFKKTTAKQLSNRTHREKPYMLTSENSPISYELAKELNVGGILPDFIE